MMFYTLLLDPNAWDLTVDSSGNIAQDSTSYAVAQDVASACRTYQGELFFRTDLGLPYYDQTLGQPLNKPLLQALLAQAALSVPGVVQAQATLNDVGVDRILTGSIDVIDETGTSLNATF